MPRVPECLSAAHLDRRSWLGLAALSAPALAQMGGGEHGHEHSGQAMPAMTMPPTPWADPRIPLSPPPPHMGHQMGVVITPNLPPLGYERDGETKVFTLIAQPVETYLTSGRHLSQTPLGPVHRFDGMGHLMPQSPRQLRGWGYNGCIPGPTIECTQGDRIRVILRNELPEPTTIHWHGIEVPNQHDGAAGLTEAPTPPGGSKTYEFTLYQSGTFLYHPHFNIMKQEAMGLAGFVVVHPRTPPHPIDKDFAIMLQEWRLLPGNPNPDVVSMDFNWFTFNGKSAPDIDVLTVNQGDRVRIRFGNLSMDDHPIHIHGYSWKVVGTEGGPIPESAQWPGATVNVSPGTTRDVEFTAWNPGVWALHCHKVHHTVNAHADVPMGIMPHGGMFTAVHVIPKDPGAPWRHPSQGDEAE